MLGVFVQSLRITRPGHGSFTKLSTRLLSTSAADLEQHKTPYVRPEVDISNNEFGLTGLNENILKALSSQNINKPTPVQKAVISRLLSRENIVMASSTGSGKTLAYSLPAIQALHNEELLGYKRLPKRPRCIVLVPTRELAQQVLQSVKQIGHFSKVSSVAVVGGEDYGVQRKLLDRMVDVVVASPGRLMQHREQGNVYFSQVNTVIIDEVDTMLTQGFGSDIRAILRNVLRRSDNVSSTDPASPLSKVQVVMATATLTKSVRALLEDMEGGGFNVEYSDPSNKTPRKIDGTERRLMMNIVEVDGLHRSLPHVQHNFEVLKGEDKLSMLHTLLARTQKKRTLVFCNTIDSCRAVDFAINDDNNGHSRKALCYHGDMNSKERAENMEAFRAGQESIMVCTDMAARGIDILDIDQVVLFDFPMNPVDYIHRAGRCGRAGRKGIVTSLIGKRDQVLATAIQNCIKKGLPIDSLTSSKRDYQDGGKLAHIAGRSTSKPVARPHTSEFSNVRGGSRDSRVRGGRGGASTAGARDGARSAGRGGSADASRRGLTGVRSGFDSARGGTGSRGNVRSGSPSRGSSSSSSGSSGRRPSPSSGRR